MTPYRPMLATSWAAPFDDDDWWFEVKWDGYRCLVTGAQGRTDLRSRRGIDLAGRFPEVAGLEVPDGWVLDGEIVVFDDDGIPDFSLLQMGERPATYMVFDVLVADGDKTVEWPFEERRRRLESAELSDRMVVTDPMAATGRALFDAVVAKGMEGVVAKRSGSQYFPGRRSADWRKIAHRRSMEAVVGGWLPGEGGRSSSFGSLLVGLWEGDELRWVGAVGSGFSSGQLGPMVDALAALERPTAPFADTAGIPKGARWTQPGIVVTVEYKEWTRDGRLRAPVFKGVGLADPKEVTWAAEGPASPPSAAWSPPPRP